MNVPRTAFLVAISLLAAPAAATAQDAAPPGNSAVDQYRESAPPTAPGSRKLTDEQRKRLSDRGSDGAALADALDGSGGVPGGGSAAGVGSAPEGATPSEGTGSAVADGGDGTGSSSGKPADASKSGGGDATQSGTDGEDGPTPAAGSAAERPETTTTSTTEAAASTTVGPFPVWLMMVGALVVVGVGLLVRRRSAA